MTVALTIAGSDPSGGAGLQADVKTFHQHNVYGMSVVTLLTVQNTQQVKAVEVLAPELVLAQLDAVLDDIRPTAAKTGALGNAGVMEAVAQSARRFPFPLVIDPVMVSKHGDLLIADDAVHVLTEQLLPQATLVTPNLAEAAKLAGREMSDLASMKAAASAISQLGPANVLIKGGHFDGEWIDLLLADGRFHHLIVDRLDTKHTHGAGCVLSAAITARLAEGHGVVSAVESAKRFVTRAIASGPNLGHGYGPLNLFAQPDDECSADA